MIVKYGAQIEPRAVEVNLQRLVNQIYKLLPNREENVDWKVPLNNILEELAGMDRLLFEQQELLFRIMCKLEGLFTLTGENDFPLYRKTIFECLNLIGELLKQCQD